LRVVVALPQLEGLKVVARGDVPEGAGHAHHARTAGTEAGHAPDHLVPEAVDEQHGGERRRGDLLEEALGLGVHRAQVGSGSHWAASVARLRWRSVSMSTLRRGSSPG